MSYPRRVSDFLQSDVGFSIQSAVSFLVVAVVALVAVSALGSRHTPDPQGTRARALYLTAVSLVALVVALVAGFGMLRPAFAALVEEEAATFDAESFDLGGFGEFTDDEFDVGSEAQDVDDRRWSAAASNGLVLVTAIGVLLAHRRRLDEVGIRVLERPAPERQTYVAHLYLVAFVTALVALFALASAGFDVFRVVAPGITGVEEDVERKAATAHLLAVGALGVAAAFLWRDSWGEAEALTGYEPPDEAAATPPAGPSGSGSASPPS